jgi:hypothetical protein
MDKLKYIIAFPFLIGKVSAVNDPWDPTFQWPGDVTYDGNWGPPMLLSSDLYLNGRRNGGAVGMKDVWDNGDMWGIHQKTIVTSQSTCVVETPDLVEMYASQPNAGWDTRNFQRMECTDSTGTKAERVGPPLSPGPSLPDIKDGYGPNFTTYFDDTTVWFDDTADWNQVCADLCARENIRRSNLPVTGNPDDDRHRNIRCYSYSKVMHPDNSGGGNKFMCQLNQCTTRRDVLNAATQYFNDQGSWSDPKIDEIRGWYGFWTDSWPGNAAATGWFWQPHTKERTSWVVSGCGLDDFRPIPEKIEFNTKWEYVGDTNDKYLFHPSASGNYLFVPYRDNPASGTSYIEVHKFNPSTNGYDLLPDTLHGSDFNFFFTGSCGNSFLVYSKGWTVEEFAVKFIDVNDDNINNWNEQIISYSQHGLVFPPNRNAFQFSEDCSVMAFFDSEGGIVRFNTNTWSTMGSPIVGTFGANIDDPVSISPDGDFGIACDVSAECKIYDYSTTPNNPVTTVFVNPTSNTAWGKAAVIDDRGSAYVARNANKLSKYNKNGVKLVDMDVDNFFTNNFVLKYGRIWGGDGTAVAYNSDQITLEHTVSPSLSISSAERVLVPRENMYMLIAGGNSDTVTIELLSYTPPIPPSQSPTASPVSTTTMSPTASPVSTTTMSPTASPVSTTTLSPTASPVSPTDPPLASNSGDFCNPNPCLNGGTCEPISSTCVCIFPYYGTLCNDERICQDTC